MLQKLILAIVLLLAFIPEANAQTKDSNSKQPNPPPMMVTKKGYFQNIKRAGEQYVICVPLDRIDGHAKHREIGVYPDTAKRLQLEGDVIVKVTVNSQGKVIDANAIKGLAIFHLAAEEAAKKWVYEPSFVVQQCGCDIKLQPVELTGTILFKYRIRN